MLTSQFAVVDPKKLRELRLARDWSQARVAAEARMSTRRVEAYENGRSLDGRVSTVYALARAFSVGAEDLLTMNHLLDGLSATSFEDL